MRQNLRAPSPAALTGGSAAPAASGSPLGRLRSSRAADRTALRTLLAGLLILGALGTGTAHANRWDQQQQQQQRPSFFAADRGERRPLFQRRQPEPAQPSREAPRFEAPQATAPTAPANVPQPRLQPGEAGRRAQQQYGGRVLSVAPADSGYHVRLLRDGEVSVVTVPNQ